MAPPFVRCLVPSVSNGYPVLVGTREDIRMFECWVHDARGVGWLNWCQVWGGGEGREEGGGGVSSA